ncbi:MAG: phosphotransferase enzyme family protein [Candidatus Hodarchaeales archaeon]
MAFEIRENVLNLISELYGIKSSQLNHTGGFENLVYSYSYDNKEFILRIKKDVNLNRKSIEQIEAEVNWINYLDKNNIPVSAPQLSKNGKYIEQVDLNNTTFFVVSFQKAPGTYINYRDPEEWNEGLWERIGEIVGKMHNLSTKYQPEGNYKRIEFEEDEFLKMEKILNAEKDKIIIDKYKKILAKILPLSKSQDAYGLVHGDLNWGNYFIHKKKEITIFDFDSCCYNWFIYDIAIAIYTFIWDDSREVAISWFEKIIPFFWKGYTKYYSLDEKWIKMMSEFLYLHDFFLYTAISETIKSGNHEEDYPSMLKILRERCLTGTSRSYYKEDEWNALFNNSLISAKS